MGGIRKFTCGVEIWWFVEMLYKFLPKSERHTKENWTWREAKEVCRVREVNCWESRVEGEEVGYGEP